MEINIYLTNLGKYNEGELVGKWFTLPIDIEEALKEIGVAYGTRYEEFFITDYEAPFKIGEYDDLDLLNEKAELLENYGDIEEILSEVIDSFPELDFYENDSDFLDNAFKTPSKAAYAVFFGDYRVNDDYVRFNGYQNLDTFTAEGKQKEIEDCSSDILNAFFGRNL